VPAAAVSVTLVVVVKLSWQVDGQLMPAGELVTVPVPLTRTFSAGPEIVPPEVAPLPAVTLTVAVELDCR
jgi:hypothetical protein